jgi:hypothetical protein
MAKSEKQEVDPAAANITASVDKILALRGKWLEAAGKDVGQGADRRLQAAAAFLSGLFQQDLEVCLSGLLRQQDMEVVIRQRDMEALASEALAEWRRLSEALVGWAIRAEVKQVTAEADADFCGAISDAREALIKNLEMALRYDNDDFVIGIFSPELAKDTLGGLTKLKYGEVEPIFEPGKRTSYKDGYTIPRLRDKALLACHFLYGTGLTMSAARSRVAAALGETAANIRNWDRAKKKELEERCENMEEKPRNPYAIHFEGAQLFGAIVTGLGRDAAIKRLKLPLDWDPNGYFWAYVNKLHDRNNRLHVWDDARLAQLGDEYQRSLKQQKSQRHKQ